jgi:ketosteroid isomerase-like protein
VAHPVDLLRALLDAMPDGRVAIQFLDAGAARATSRQHFYGHDRAGAEAEIAIGQVLTLRDGRIARAELFEPDDEAGMRSRLERLEPDVDWGPATRLAQRYFDCINSPDYDGVRECYTEAFRFLDHRLASPLSGGFSAEQQIASFKAMFASATDAQMRADHLGEVSGVWLGK